MSTPCALPLCHVLPESSDNSGVSVSDSGAADSGGSEFVVAGSPVPAAGDDKGDNFDPSALAIDLLQEVALQVERQSEPSMRLQPQHQALGCPKSVSSFARASCAQREHEPSVTGDRASRGQPSDGSGACGFLSRLAAPSDSSLRVNLGLAFGDAFGRISDGGTSDLVMPWETPLMRAIFSDDPGACVSLSSKPPTMVGSVPALPLPSQQTGSGRSRREVEWVDLSLAAQTVQPLKDEDVLRKQQRMIEQGVAKWRLIYGRYARNLSEAAPDEDSILASLGTRSPHTILKRANAVLAYLRWFDVFVEAGASAFGEEAYWKYVKFMKRSGSAASCGTSFLSGIRFAKHVVGMEELDDPSRRCEGGCGQLASEAAIVKQAEALSVGQLRRFHDLLHREGADAWAVPSALIALCVHMGGARASARANARANARSRRGHGHGRVLLDQLAVTKLGQRPARWRARNIGFLNKRRTSSLPSSANHCTSQSPLVKPR